MDRTCPGPPVLSQANWANPIQGSVDNHRDKPRKPKHFLTDLGQSDLGQPGWGPIGWDHKGGEGEKRGEEWEMGELVICGLRTGA